MIRILSSKRLITTLFWSTSGSVAAITGIMLTVLLGFVAFAIDLGRLTLVKSELQRAADSGALAGARGLVPYSTQKGEVDSIWSTISLDAAKAAAKSAVIANTAEGNFLSHCNIDFGYWDMTSKSLQPTNITPTEQQLPAARVTISKTSGQNNGPVNFSFGSFVGKESADLTVQAVAVLPLGIGSVAPGGAFPIAIRKSVVEKNFNDLIKLLGDDSNGNSSKEKNSKKDDADGDSGDDSPKGFWTTLTDEKGTSAIKDLISGKSPSPALTIGDKIYLTPGEKTGAFNDNVIDGRIGTTVLLPVIPDSAEVKQEAKIVGFVAFEIKEVYKHGNKSYVAGYLRKYYGAPGTTTETTGGTSPKNFVYTSNPKLVH